MAVRINPCFRCPLSVGCELKAQWSAKLRGLGLRSANFKCDRLLAEMRVGRRIEISTPVAEGTEFGESISRERVKATITAVKPDATFACTVDPNDARELTIEDKFRFRRSRPRFRIERFLDEPDGVVCGFGVCVRDGKCDHHPERDSCWCENQREHERMLAEHAA